MVRRGVRRENRKKDGKRLRRGEAKRERGRGIREKGERKGTETYIIVERAATRETII